MRTGSCATGLSVGGFYQPDSLEQARLLMTAYYYDLGMVDIQVSPEQVALSEDQTSLSITIAITEGPVYRLVSITLGRRASRAA